MVYKIVVWKGIIIPYFRCFKIKFDGDKDELRDRITNAIIDCNTITFTDIKGNLRFFNTMEVRKINIK